MTMFTPPLLNFNKLNQRTHKFSKSILTIAILSSLALVGCGDNNSNKPAEQATAQSTNTADTASTPPDTPTQQTTDATQKLNAYIDCGNQNQMVQRSYHHYSRWVKDMNAGPTGKEPVINGTLEIIAPIIERCTTKLTEAVALTPALPELDKAASELATTFTAFTEINNKAYTYYEQQNYKDDDFTQGKAMHPEFVKAYEAFKTANDAFNVALDAENNKVQNAELAKIEQTEGKKYAYWSLATSMKAKTMVDMISQESFDAEKASALLTEYETSMTELKNQISAKGADVPANADIMVSDLDELLSAAKKRIRRVRNNEAYTQAEIHQLNAGSPMVDGSEANVVEMYNRFVQKANIVQ
ncbi:Uncharacterised protein [Moraxella lacunata]|uniref:DUF3829 domain-containing protein n=1 Tax=Moraxella lacunata TaxID=477 RepID=A0A378TU91_MORLA|nr:YiiG family protein [Moraxella lacunata]STZ64307.1 Uncharacterised protein [Moraxella lacunata]